MTVKLVPIPIQESFQFVLPNRFYENNEPIQQVYVNWSCGIVAWMRPKKQNGILQPVQRVVLSPYIAGEITGIGKVINISPEGKSVSYEDYMLRNGIAIFCEFN